MYYFDAFPQIYYTFDPKQQEFYTLKNIFTRVNVLSAVLTDSLVYYKYTMQDGDTLENMAFKLYGDPLRHWIIIFANTIIDPYFDLPLSQDNFANNIILKYGSAANAQSQLDHITQTETVVTSKNGLSNTQVYTTTVTSEPFTYNFLTGALVARTLPTLNLPQITVSSYTVTTPDGSTVTTTTTLNAVSAYQNEVNINEAKREIILIDPSYCTQIEAEFASLLSTG
jgi:hypothetical protein